ncbi:MAG: hypothetical protein ACM3S4_05815 [Burkholderiales bacterium]
MSAVFHRELKDYFNTMLGYVFIGSFLFLSGILFTVNNILALNAEFNTTLNDCIYVFMLVVPLLTMRLIAEEKKTKRDQLLLTSSLTLPAIILGKYLAAVCVFAITLCFTLVYPIILLMLGNPPVLMIINGYLGFFLIGAAFIAVGVLISTLTENQLSAAVATYGILLLFLTLDFLIAQVRSPFINTVLQWFSLFRRFEPYQFGTFSISSTIYYIAFSAVFVSLSTMMLERRRWSSI